MGRPPWLYYKGKDTIIELSIHITNKDEDKIVVTGHKFTILSPHKYKYETKALLHEGDRYYYPIRKEKEYEERAIPYYDLYPRLGARSGIHLNLYFRIPFVIDKATIEHLLECRLTTWIHKEHGKWISSNRRLSCKFRIE